MNILIHRKRGRNLSALSTIITIIIILSFTVTLAIGTAFWVMGLAGSFKKFEVVNFLSAYADPPSYYNGTLLQPDGNYFNGTAFTIHLKLKNAGTATATISNIFLGSRPYDLAYGNITQTNLINKSLAPGQILMGTITLPFDNTSGWASGSSVEVDIETAAGITYSNTVVLL
jgi:hypothetical protein